MKSILIVNARIVNEGTVSEGDLLVREGRVAELGPDLSHRDADLVLDAGEKLLVPGMIDDQVHFREPGLTHKADIATESRAAVAGGITSFMDMPNTQPQTVTLDALEGKYRLAATRSRANYAFYLGATNDNIDEIRRLRPGMACGIKVFMGASTGNMLVDDPATLRVLFRDAPALLAAHCEHTPTIQENERRFRERFGEDVPMEYHPHIRSAEACYRSSSLAVGLAREQGTRLHVLHLTTARELELFVAGPVEGKQITAEACIHHLYFDDRDYAEKGTLIKCNPAIKTPADREALIGGVGGGRLDVIGTDHAPHTLEEKAHTYFKAPAGLPLVQYALPALFELYHQGRLSVGQLVDRTSHAVARCFRIQDRGFIREGYWADLVLLDTEAPFTVRREDVLSKCGWSPFEGRRFRTAVDTTLVSGRIAYRRGQPAGEVHGERLAFDRQR